MNEMERDLKDTEKERLKYLKMVGIEDFFDKVYFPDLDIGYKLLKGDKSVIVEKNKKEELMKILKVSQVADCSFGFINFYKNPETENIEKYLFLNLINVSRGDLAGIMQQYFKLNRTKFRGEIFDQKEVKNLFLTRYINLFPKVKELTEKILSINIYNHRATSVVIEDGESCEEVSLTKANCLELSTFFSNLSDIL